MYSIIHVDSEIKFAAWPTLSYGFVVDDSTINIFLVL